MGRSRCPGMDDMLGRRRSPTNQVLLGLLILAVLISGWTAFVFPRLDQARADPPAHTEVIYLLGGEEHGAEMGFRMLDEGRGDTLVLSWVGDEVPECITGYRGHRVICVEPYPATTQGEAMLLPQLMDQNEWKSVTVATWPAHLPRTRLLFERCYSSHISYAATSQQYGDIERVTKAMYETFSLAKAVATPGCSDMLPFGLSDGVVN